MTFACVWTGPKYSPKYVARLGRAIRRHYSKDCRLVCLTNNVATIPGWEMVDISEHNLSGWWAKMLLFRPDVRGPGDCVYMDLDTVVVGELEPLTECTHSFAICQNFTKLAGHPNWPCKYGSCVMFFRDGWGVDVWNIFARRTHAIMERAGKYGDQMAIEAILPDAHYLQDEMPPGYFVGYRDLPQHQKAPPPGASIIVFAGRNKPDNCDLDWVKKEWV